MNETLIYIAVLIATLTGIHVWARWYSRRYYEYFPCKPCRGSGKKWELWVVMVLCGRLRKRAFTACPACGGTAKVTRR